MLPPGMLGGDFHTKSFIGINLGCHISLHFQILAINFINGS